MLTSPRPGEMTIRCHTCPQVDTVRDATFSQARDRLARRGWTHAPRDREHCPACSAAGKDRPHG